MSRNSSGTYTLPNAPFTPNTPIRSSITNSNNDDIASALTDSLSRTGLGGMQTALPLATAGFFYSADPNTGMSRPSADTQEITVGGQNWTFTTTDLTAPGGVSLLALVGEVRLFALKTPPTGWIFLYGQPCTGSTPQWRNALIADGSPFGTNGSDPFFPDLRCVVPAGTANMGGTNRGILTGGDVFGALLGNQSVTLDLTQIPSHDHTGSSIDNALGGVSFQYNTSQFKNQSFSLPGSSGNTWGGTNTAATTDTHDFAHTHPFTIVPAGGGGGHANVQPTIILNYIGRSV